MNVFTLNRRRRERLCLVVLGILLVSFAAGLAAATARSAQGTIDEELARQWRTDYDLLVRHPNAVSEVEKATGYVSAKYQSNQAAEGYIGITLEQLERIRAIPGVEVAAPMAVIGPASWRYYWGEDSVHIPLDFGELQPGIYRRIVTISRHNGIDEILTTHSDYFLVNDRREIERSGNYFSSYLSYFPDQVSLTEFSLNVVAVDFAAEEALHGLKSAIITGDVPRPIFEVDGVFQIPALLNVNAVPEGDVFVQVELLEGVKPDRETLRLAAEYPSIYWRDFPGRTVFTDSFALNEKFTFPQLKTWFAQTYTRASSSREYILNGEQLEVYATGLGITSNWDDGWGVRWTYDYRAPNVLFGSAVDLSGTGVWGYFFPGHLEEGTVFFALAGLFDPDLLDIQPPDSPVAAPLELYRLSQDPILRLRDGSEPTEPTYARSVHPYDFAGSPIGMLVPIEAVPRTLGVAGIDSIRVRVSDVEDMSEASQLRIEAVAERIRRETGLHVDVVLGSSKKRQQVYHYDYNSPGREEYVGAVTAAMDELIPQVSQLAGFSATWDFCRFELELMRGGPWGWDYSIPNVFLPIRIPEEDRYALLQKIDGPLAETFRDLGYEEFEYRFDNDFFRIVIPEYEIDESEQRDLFAVVEQYWTQLGTQMKIYRETNQGTFWVTVGLLAVSALFIGNTTYISTVGRTREFSTLRTLGWRKGTVFKVSLVETLAISLLAGLITAASLAVVWHYRAPYLESWLLLTVPPAVAITFIIGSLLPLFRTISIPPLMGTRQGELKADVALGGARPLGFVLRGLAARPARTLVTFFALTVPAWMLAFMFFVYFGVQALLGETMIGEHIALELKGYHFLLNALIFAVAGLAVTDTLLINLRERQKEFGILKAIGWKNSTVAGLLLWEGVGLGLLSGVIGTVIAGVVYTQVFAMLPPGVWVNGPLLAVVPALVAGLAAIVPALRAARIPAAQVIREE